MNDSAIGKHLPFAWKAGNDTLAILIHGYAGSPDQFRMLASELFASGIDCAALLLPGHGEDTKALGRCKSENWRSHSWEEINRLRIGYQRIFLIGHSLGGLLSLEYAADNPVDGVISISAPMGIRVSLFPVILGLRMMLSDPVQDQPILKAYRDGFGIQMIGLINPLAFVKPTIALIMSIRRVRRTLSQINIPVLLIQSKNDESIAKKSADRIARSIKQTTRILWLKQSRHAYLVPEERELVTEEVQAMVHLTVPSGKSLARSSPDQV